MTTTDVPERTSNTDHLHLSRLDRAMNATVRGLAHAGISIQGTRVLAVRGRNSGEWRTVVLNPITVDGVRYLVAPRGETQWVRNLRVAGEGELRLGRRVESFTATEVPVADRAPVLRAYLAAYGWSAGRYFAVDAASNADEMAAASPDHPVFRLGRGRAHRGPAGQG
ncbi:MAG: nitroreductase family deazaflavin-dependent oxidoreductase [Acidimicrobiales bacterium]|nr:nitroreductase family deazaflavin-dependent oxidoreductase [Acidimicrobiales bacterium]